MQDFPFKTQKINDAFFILYRPINYNEHTKFHSFQQGEEKGFAYYFHLHYRASLYFAKRLLKEDSLAEDIVENSFIKLYERRETIQSETTLKGFLYTSIKNGCLDKIEQNKIRSLHHQKISYSQPLTQRCIAEEMIRTEMLDIIYKSIEDLPPATKKVFQLYYMEGKSYDEIALELNRSKETIKKQRQLGILLLKRKLLPIFILLFVLACTA